MTLSFGDIPGAFDACAPSYDKLVDANPGYHMHLRLSAQRMRLPGRGEGLRLLDAGCGTGASNGFSSVRSDTMPGWQRNIVHTFLGQAPR